MPYFSTYRGELPASLDPLNPRHYLLLAYWVYFRPTALKCYFYLADPDLYRAGPGQGIFRTWRIPPYRHLYLMLPVVSLILSALVGLPIVLAASWIQGTPVAWGEWAVGVALGAALGVEVGVAGGVVGGVAGGVAGGVVGGVALGVAGGVALGVALGVKLGVAVGVAVDVAVGVALGVALGVAGGVALGVALGVAVGLAGGVALGLAFGVALGSGVLRFIFYPFQLGPAWRSASRGGRHPLEWDELAVLPLPGTRRALARRLREDESDGLYFAASIAHNPFQRWIAQAALQSYLHKHQAPLHCLYSLLVQPALDSYVSAPITRQDWGQVPTSRQLLLGELGGHWVDCSSDWINRLAERLVWGLSWLLRDRRQTPLTRLAGMLYELLDEKTSEADSFDLAAYAEIYTAPAGYPGGAEIARSFEALAAFLSYDDLPALPAAVGVASGLADTHNPIRPAVLAALTRLGEVGAEVATYRDSTSRVSKLSALARATDALDDLDEYVLAEVMAPEQYILRRIIRQWRRLVSEAGGEVGRAEEMRPVANPYVVANPVVAELFVGREDILRRLEELWAGEGQCPSVVLYGHRRMGKSSILHNLGARFGARTLVVDFNMQRVGLVANTGELLHNLALALYDSLSARGGRLEGGEPDEEAFGAHNPYTAFDRFLKRLDRARGQRRFIVTVDEFQLIEKMIVEGQLEPHLLDFWRGLIQTYPWFIMAFAGLHTLQEMTHDYWHPLYGSVMAIPVSFLGHGAAWQLITQPVPDFPIDYDTEAVERVIALTNGQPYLIQLIGHGLVTGFNRQTFEEGVERERRFSLADVEAVIGATEFFRAGDAYFTGVWRQAETGPPPGQTAVLRALAHTEAGMTGQEIAREVELTSEQVKQALDTLKRHDVMIEEDGRWRFTVELMRRWVAGKEGDR
jgi:hypothetical protein